MPRELLTMTGTYAQFEGTEIVAENCLGAKIKDLVIKGKTYQNLIKPTSFTVNAPCTLFGVKSSTIYTIIVKNNSNTNKQLNYAFYNGTGRYYDNVLIRPNSDIGIYKKIITTRSDTTDLYLYFVANSEGETMDTSYKNVVLLKGDYTNTDLPNSINGIESVAEGDKNLVNTATIYQNMRESGSVGSLFNPVTDGGYDVYMMKIQPNTEYLINLDGYGQAPWVRCYDENYKIVKSGNAGSNKLSYTWSVKSGNNYYYLEFNKPKSFTGTFRVYKKENEYPLKLAVNEEINFINLPIPLRSLPNGTCDTIENNQLIQRVGKIVIDGTQSFTLSNVNQTETIRGYFELYAKESKGYNNLICNWYIRNGDHGDYEYIMITNKLLFISVLKSKLETADENGLKKYFSENPLSVYYELITPITHSLEIPSISTIRGTNVVTCDNNIKSVISCKLKLSKARITS